MVHDACPPVDDVAVKVAIENAGNLVDVRASVQPAATKGQYEVQYNLPAENGPQP